jgi:curved DNA-binding protein CbpA
MMNFFKSCIKLEDIRPLFKELALKFHPDRGGDTRTMQILNDEYHQALKSFEGAKLFNHKTKEEYTYKYDYKSEEALASKINEVIGLKLDNIELEVIGSWLWIHKTSKEQAKLFNKDGLGCNFSGVHTAWFWHKGIRSAFRGKRSGLNLDQIRGVFGSETIEHDRNKQIA